MRHIIHVHELILALLLVSAVNSCTVNHINDCYMQEKGAETLLGNSKIEIRLDSKTGGVKGLLNKDAKVEYFTTGAIAEVFRLTHCTYALHGAMPGDIWSAVSGTVISSSNQVVTSKKFNRTDDGGKVEIIYEQLALEKRTIDVRITYTIELKTRDEETKWNIRIENNDEGTIREVHFPVLSGLNALDDLIMPNHSGQKLTDPVNKLSDEIPVITLEYPARASMQWFEYYSAGTGLYLASYDKQLGYEKLCFGRSGEKKDAAMWIVKYPFAVSRSSWSSPDYAVAGHSGDWHWGADRYRRWMGTWAGDQGVSRWIREIPRGLGDIWVQAGTPEGSVPFARIGNRARELREQEHAGAMSLLGWYAGGGIVGKAPDYTLLPEMGDTTDLASSIEQAHGYNVAVGVYVNSRLADTEADMYKDHGREWIVRGKSRELGTPTIETFDLFYGNHATMCPAAQGWQNCLVEQFTRAIKNYRLDGLFIDQTGSYYAELCYNRDHGHSTPATAWGPGNLELLRRTREATRKTNPDSYLWIEGMVDAYGQYVDCFLDKNPVMEPMRIHPEMQTFPEMWRYTFPGFITVNDPAVYSYPPAKDLVYGEYYYFVMGIRLTWPPDNKMAGGSTEEELSRHRAVVERIDKLWPSAKDFLCYGRFMDDIGLKVSCPGVLGKVYMTDTGLAVPLWNTSADPVKCTITLDLAALGREDEKINTVISLSSGMQLPCKVRKHSANIEIQLRPRDIDMLVLKLEK
jgi:hypothetical protein